MFIAFLSVPFNVRLKLSIIYMSLDDHPGAAKRAGRSSMLENTEGEEAKQESACDLTKIVRMRIN